MKDGVFDKYVESSVDEMTQEVVSEYRRIKGSEKFAGTRPAIASIAARLGLPESFVLMALEKSGEQIWEN